MAHDGPYVSRGGEKLAAALEAFELDVAGSVCADFGCNVGGFTDCLLRRGARKVYAVDTGYGQLAYRLRKDPRVVVMERTNVLHCPVPEPVDLVAADMAWTPQARIVPAAAEWLARPHGRLISLLKVHYEWAKMSIGRSREPISPTQGRDICRQVCQSFSDGPLVLRAAMISPLRGKGGNMEFLLLLAP
jgi:23S rRNA (cytidine1920-2'-O)/16S rRNA (cytidine1409-2'-O)-methyltransferase